MTGGSPPSRPHASWHRPGSHRRGRGGGGGGGGGGTNGGGGASGGAGAGGAAGSGSGGASGGGGGSAGGWNVAGRRARSPGTSHGRRHRGYRSGGPQGPGGRGHFHARYNWQGRSSPGSPHRDGPGWPRGGYRGQHGGAGGGVRRGGSVPPVKAGGDGVGGGGVEGGGGSSGGGGGVGGGVVVRERRDSVPPVARRSYSPSHWGADTARAPPMSAHMHAPRARAPAMTGPRAAPGAPPARALGPPFYGARAHGPKDKFATPTDDTPAPAPGGPLHQPRQGPHAPLRGVRGMMASAQENSFGRKRHGPARVMRSPQRSPPQRSPPQRSPPQRSPPQRSPPQRSPPQRLQPQRSPPQRSPLQRPLRADSPQMDRIAPALLPPALGADCKDGDGRAFYGAKGEGPRRGGVQKPLRDDIDRRNGRPDELSIKGGSRGPVSKDLVSRGFGKGAFGKDLNDSKESTMRFGGGRPQMRNVMIRDGAIRAENLRNERFRGHAPRGGFEPGGGFRGPPRGSGVQDGGMLQKSVRNEQQRVHYGRLDGPRNVNARIHMPRDIIARADVRDHIPWEGSIRDSAVLDGLLRDGLRRDSLIRDGLIRDGPVREGPIRDGAVRDAPLREGAVRDGAVRDGPVRDGAVRDGPVRDGSVRDGHARESSMREGLMREGPMREISVRESSMRDISMRESSMREASMRESSMREASMREASMREASMRESSMREASMREASMREASMRESSMREASMRESSMRESAMREASIREGLKREGSLRQGSMREAPVHDAPMRESSMREGPMREGPMREGLMRDVSLSEGRMRDGPVREVHIREGPISKSHVRDGMMYDGPTRDTFMRTAPMREPMREAYMRDVGIRDGNMRTGGPRDHSNRDVGLMRERASPTDGQRRNSRDEDLRKAVGLDAPLRNSYPRAGAPSEGPNRVYPHRDGGFAYDRGVRFTRVGFRPDGPIQNNLHRKTARYGSHAPRDASPRDSSALNSAPPAPSEAASPIISKVLREPAKITSSSPVIKRAEKLHSSRETHVRNDAGKIEISKAGSADGLTPKSDTGKGKLVQDVNLRVAKSDSDRVVRRDADMKKDPNTEIPHVIGAVQRAKLTPEPHTRSDRVWHAERAASSNHDDSVSNHTAPPESSLLGPLYSPSKRSPRNFTNPASEITHGKKPRGLTSSPATPNLLSSSAANVSEPDRRSISVAPIEDDCIPKAVPPLVPLLRSSLAAEADVTNLAVPSTRINGTQSRAAGADRTVSKTGKPLSPSPNKQVLRLLAEISEVDSEMKAIKEKIENGKRETVLNGSRPTKNKVEEARDVNNSVKTAQPQDLASLVSRRAAQAENIIEPPFRHFDPIHAPLALILNANRARAREASQALRGFCHDPSEGLDSKTFSPSSTGVDDSVAAKISEWIHNRRAANHQRRKNLAKEYVLRKITWHRRLKTMRIKCSREKREIGKERDRYLLVHTRGASALMTCRTSSGRTSTKVLPGVTPGGVLTNTAELDSMLVDIENAGGTPGAHHIWGKTLAEVPDQDPNYIPFDGGGVLITDPIREEHNIRSVNPWTREEKLIFLDKYCLYQKNFFKIATFLEHKSTNDCVHFYFRNKLDLGLKQLLRESSSMKRKGIRNEHLLKLVGLPMNRQNLALFGIQLGASNAAANNSTMAEVEAPVFNAQSSKLVGSPSILRKMKLKKQSVSPKIAASASKHESVLEDGSGLETLDFNAEQRRAFCDALRTHGTNWYVISESTALLAFDAGQLKDYYDRKKDDYGFQSYVKKSEGREPAVKVEASVAPSAHKRSEAADGVANRKVSDSEGNMSSRKPAFGKSQLKSCAGTTPKRAVPPLVIPKHSFQVSGRRSPLLSARDGSSAAEGLDPTEERQSSKPKASWTAEERERVKQHFITHGKDFKHIAMLMESKTPAQVKGYWKMIQERNIRGESSKSAKQEKKKNRRHSTGEKLSPTLARTSGSRRQGITDSVGKDSERENRKRDADDADLGESRSGSLKREKHR